MSRRSERVPLLSAVRVVGGFGMLSAACYQAKVGKPRYPLTRLPRLPDTAGTDATSGRVNFTGQFCAIRYRAGMGALLKDASALA